jgi:hypothetical protein
MISNIFCTIWILASTVLAHIGPIPVMLGTSSNFAVLSKTGITNVPYSVIVGDMGTSPIAATAITGFTLTMDSSNEFSTSSQVTGKVYAADYINNKLTVAVLDMQAAYVDISTRSNADYIELYGGLLSGVTFTPALYKWTSDLYIYGDIYLTGGSNDTWIMHTTGNIIIGANTNIILRNGSSANNIVWSAAGIITLMVGSHMEGTLLASGQVVLLTGSSLTGRILSHTAVVLQSVSIS